MAVTHGERRRRERCLLGRQASWPAGRYSTLAGFCEPGETLEDAVRREVAEEVGVPVGEVTYFGNQPWPLPASLMLGFMARGDDHARSTSTSHEIEDARWFTRAEMRGRVRRRPLVMPGGVSISRSLLEHWFGGAAPRQLVAARPASVRVRRSCGELVLDLGQRRVGLRGAVGVHQRRHRLVAAVGGSTISRGLGVLLDVDDVEGDPLAVQLALQPVAVAAPGGLYIVKEPLIVGTVASGV